MVWRSTTSATAAHALASDRVSVNDLKESVFIRMGRQHLKSLL
jgi:hypothetical protein